MTRDQPPFGEALRAELGVPVESVVLESSPRSRVWRVELESGVPVVVKQLIAGPEAADRYAREVAALQIAGRAQVAVAPKALGVQPGQLVVVLEHLEHRPPAEDWIVGYAESLAHLHATARASDAGGSLPRWSAPGEADVAAFLRLAGALEVPAGDEVAVELRALVERLEEAPGTALLHGDPCPGNDLHTPDGVRFIDFEQASLGSGLMELAYLRIGFPTCWCVTRASDALLARAESAYLSAWRDATGTDPAEDVEAALVDACAGWVLRGDALVQRAERGVTDQLARVVEEDWEWGTVTARRRLAHRLGVVAESACGQGPLKRTAELCGRMRAAALTRWPDLAPVPVRRP
ncbi:phosphotransferase family protein [Streptomyces xanthii]|uniref:phosphotransferase family protein n=1 Tax=Streptomyces xanthii TaxID=2768069 RepID=UPI001CB7991B|nr:aminoglycoside phosphotransferase family protein [Streptomyces xanthii]